MKLFHLAYSPASCREPLIEAPAEQAPADKLSHELEVMQDRSAAWGDYDEQAYLDDLSDGVKRGYF